MRISALFLLSAVLVAACGGEPEDTRPGQPVAHRRAAFNELIKNFEPMGVMLRANEYNGAKFRTLAMNVVALRDEPWKYFTPDTLYPPSHAKAEVWTQAEKFESEKKVFFKATDKLAAAMGTPDAPPNERVAQVAFAAVEDTCKSCHKAFKTR
jgi:cytochrome c556